MYTLELGGIEKIMTVWYWFQISHITKYHGILSFIIIHIKMLPSISKVILSISLEVYHK